jgi:RNA polymerase sigma-70 factor, ECF subfamily
LATDSEGLLASLGERLGPEQRAAAGDELAVVLADRLAQARARHPRLRVGADAFAAALARAIGAAPDPLAALARAHSDDLYLVAAIVGGDVNAIAVFEAEAIEPIARVLAHMQPSAVLVDEVKQLVRTKLLLADGERGVRVGEYSGRGELRSWVGVIATREALSLLRREAKTATPGDDALLAMPSPLTGPELGFLKERYRDEFRAAFTAALAELTPRDRNSLRHHYVHGLTIDQLATMYGVHRSNAARRIAKGRDALLSATRRRLVLGLNVDRVEFDSIMRLIESRIDVSIQRMLGADEGAHAP